MYGGGCVSVLPFVVIIGGLAQDVIDNISLETGTGNYQNIVHPEDVEGLRIQAEKDLVSLITCTPYGLNTKRLVVTGERIPYTEKQEQEIVPGSMSFRELVFTALPFLYLVVGIGSMIRKKRGKRSSNETQKD